MGMRGGGTAPSSTVICERQALLVDGNEGWRGCWHTLVDGDALYPPPT